MSPKKQHLAGAPALLNFPTDRPRPAVQKFQGESQTLVLNGALAESLKILSRRQDATLFMTLLAIFKTLLSLVSWHNSVFNISASDRATLLAGVSFEASVWELWPYMSRGASLDLPPDDLRSSPEGLRDWITQRAVTVSFVPTPVAEPMLALEWSSETKLRTLLTGGDRLHTWPTSALPFAVVNNYGPTENAVVSTSGLVSREGGAPGRRPHSADRSAMSAFTSWTSAASPCRSASSESFGSVGIAWREAISIGLSSPLNCLCPMR